jgi:hypothetical protein
MTEYGIMSNCQCLEELLARHLMHGQGKENGNAHACTHWNCYTRPDMHACEYVTDLVSYKTKGELDA